LEVGWKWRPDLSRKCFLIASCSRDWLPADEFWEVIGSSGSNQWIDHLMGSEYNDIIGRW
jgi:hypothetical protein